MQYPARGTKKLVRDEVKYCQMKKKSRNLAINSVSCAEHIFYSGGFHEDFKIKALARGAKASGWRGVSEWQRFYII